MKITTSTNCHKVIRLQAIHVKAVKVKAIFVFIFSLVLADQAIAEHHLEKRWVAEGLQVPESVYFYKDKRNTYLFVSQVDGQPAAVDGKGEVGKISLEGEVTSQEWVTGLNAPKGMGVFNNKLYVADIDRVVVINIKSAEIEKSYHIEGSSFLNDIVVDKKGIIYVSDTQTAKVYRIQSETVDTYIDKIDGANGVALVGDNLIVGGNSKLWLVDPKKNKLLIASGFAQAIDGVMPVAKGDFIVSCWAGLIYYVHLDGKIDLLLDVQKEKINTADIGFDPEKNMLYVPNFFKNTVTAYELITN